MNITFNADEIFEMAEEIEHHGGKFYREAAKNAPDKKTKQMLLGLAVMEDGHLRTFKEMREQLSGQEKGQAVFDPDNEAIMYLQTMADSHGAEGKISPTKRLTGKETIKEILEIALNSEKDSVVFYFGLRSFVSEKAGKDKVEGIIKEEIGHIAVISQKLAELKQPK